MNAMMVIRSVEMAVRLLVKSSISIYARMIQKARVTVFMMARLP